MRHDSRESQLRHGGIAGFLLAVAAGLLPACNIDFLPPHFRVQNDTQERIDIIYLVPEGEMDLGDARPPPRRH